jgi:hypothetical protein
MCARKYRIRREERQKIHLEGVGTENTPIVRGTHLKVCPQEVYQPSIRCGGEVDVIPIVRVGVGGPQDVPVKTSARDGQVTFGEEVHEACILW